ncbi:MAG: Helix-turn-helix domain [Firmicutes bacterium]|nr:Helix-turn-helix domain [Bacillota bacterium]
MDMVNKQAIKTALRELLAPTIEEILIELVESETLDRTYSTEEVAARYDVSIITVCNWLRSKKLNALKIGKVYRIRREDLCEFEQAQLSR